MGKKLYSNVVLDSKLGEGHFGTTWKAHTNESKNDVADDDQQPTVVVKVPKGEVDFKEYRVVLSLLPHRNLVTQLGIAIVGIGKKFCLVSELCELGSLDQLHHKMDLTNTTTLTRIIQDLCAGLSHMHDTLEILHKDIACRNLLMRQDKR